MELEPMDNLKFQDDSEIKKIIEDENIKYSEKIKKHSQGIINKNQERNFLITEKAYYNLKGKKLKRRIALEALKGVTISKVSDQFLIHGNQNEYDYLFSSPNRLTIITWLQNMFNEATHKDLLFCIKDEKDLVKFLVGESERKKKPDLFKIDPKEFMSIREFIDSGGSTNINNHPESQKLEEIFKKNNLFKENESLSNFDIIARIGKGSTSNVYLANYQGENVALKVFDKVFLYQNDLLDNVELEKNILSSFPEEKSLCQMKFWFFTETKIVFVLPFYQGGDLYSMLEQNGSFDELNAAFYAIQVAQMLSFLHSKNIIYRDLKPENLMVNENGYLTLIDFGSCKIVEEKNELESSFIGSIDYMSPEVVSGEGHSFMSDWWSFGILLYELLYGIPPFHGDNTERILDLIVNANVRFSSLIKLNTSAKDLINKLLKKKPKERLGQDEFKQITKHIFFQSVNVQSIISQKFNSQCLPNITQDPLSNFDGAYINQGIENFDDSTNSNLLNDVDNLLKSFKN